MKPLDDIIKRKNPYLFKAKDSPGAHDFITAVLDATVSSDEESTFGNFMERVAISGFCNDGVIDQDRLIRFNSGQVAPSDGSHPASAVDASGKPC